MNSLILPHSTVRLINGAGANYRHPGLQLDKFSIPGDQQAQKAALDKVCRIPGDSNLLAPLTERRNRILAEPPGATSFCCETTAPLTLHLSRASALENAGICLHPLYGFAYLPGSGLKGMARAYAETVWLPAQSDQKRAWRQIEDVFGWAPNPDRKEQIKDPNHPAQARRENETDPNSPEVNASCGNIVFHDAWPMEWPKLFVDIVNNHHPDYYQHDDNDHPPGDWENPVPVYFLAVKPGTTFTFGVSKRRSDMPDDLLALARQWLLGALCHLGAGAKTNAGYGAFRPANDVDAALQSTVDGTWNQAVCMSLDAPRGAASVPADRPRRAVFETTLELVTPAFLAGADQYGPAAAEGCDLRPATLRGHLRWWWRTMHAGFLDVKTLRALEAAIWGNTRAGGAVRIVIEPIGKRADSPVVQLYKKREKANFNDQQKSGPLGIPNGNSRKVTQGLWYASYGMDETNRRRHVMLPPASWHLCLVVRPTRFFTNRADAAGPSKPNQGKPITAEQALDQAKAALWLLCHFGGIGSKARKGFGSLGASGFGAWTLEKCRGVAEELRAGLELPNMFTEGRAHSSSLRQMLDRVEVVFSWPDVWQVLDQVGFAYQAFAKEYKHKREKMALGLPRRIGQPVQGAFNPTPPVTPNGRHSSPVHIHIARNDGGWLVRVVAFPAAHLPNLATSRAFLTGFLKDLYADLRRRAELKPPPPAPAHGKPSRSEQGSVASTGPTLPNAGDRVEALLLDQKTRKGGWKARHEPSGLSGPIQNSADVPGDRKPGDKLTLIVASANQREIAFRYPTADDEQRAQRTQNKAERRPGRQRKER